MKRLDRLVIKELIGPWSFGVALFGALLFAAIWLGKVTEYVSKGAPGDMVAQLGLLLLPGILVQTFAMSSLLGSLLAFGRLSADSEVVAIRAAGVSLFRMIMPVAGFSIIVALGAFALNEFYVPVAAKQSQVLLNRIAESLQGTSSNATVVPIKKDGKLAGMVMASSFSPDAKTLRGVYVISIGPDGKPTAYMNAAELVYSSASELANNYSGWRIRGGADILSADGITKYHIQEAWPDEVVKVDATPLDFLSKGLKSFETLSMKELKQKIEEGVDDPTVSKKDLRNYEYGYWNKIALPLAAFIFGTLGAALGIRNHRTGTAAGFALAVAIIFSYFTIANFMNVWALSGFFPPIIASFTPVAIGFIASVIIIWRRNA